MKRKIIIGGTLKEAGKRFIDVWHRAERGEKVAPESAITFVSFESLWKVMTDKRHELLKHLHRHPAPNVRALAKALKRDYKNVYEDVQALAAIGLIDNSGKTLRAEYDEIRSSLTI
jgi:predicted transcriptional regulator